MSIYEVKVSRFIGNTRVTTTVETHANHSVDAIVHAVRALSIKDTAINVFVKRTQAEVHHV